MTRGQVRTLWIAILLLLAVATTVSYQFIRGVRAQIGQKQTELAASRQELDNVSRLSAALAVLDRLTIDEGTATRLEILRHLGLEQTDYDVDIGSRQQKQVGGVNLAYHTIKVTAQLPYIAALTVADQLYNTGKIVVTGLTLNTPDPNHPEADVRLELQGTLYGLEKRQTTP
jgi:hypothetical protein